MGRAGEEGSGRRGSRERRGGRPGLTASLGHLCPGHKPRALTQLLTVPSRPGTGVPSLEEAPAERRHPSGVRPGDGVARGPGGGSRGPKGRACSAWRRRERAFLTAIPAAPGPTGSGHPEEKRNVS